MNNDTKQKLLDLYNAVNTMMAHVGAEGDISVRHSACDEVMSKLYAIDDGVWDENKFKKMLEG